MVQFFFSVSMAAPMYSLPSGRVLFGAFELDLSTGELRSTETPDPNHKVLLREQVFQVLRLLLEREGKIVTREEIKTRLWANDTVVDFDRSINETIKTLRRTLGDSADHPRYIETLARRGYRLMLPIQYLESAPGTALEKDREQHEQSAAEMSENAASSAAGKAALVESCARACVCCHFGRRGLYFLAALWGNRIDKLAKNQARRTAVCESHWRSQ